MFKTVNARLQQAIKQRSQRTLSPNLSNRISQYLDIRHSQNVQDCDSLSRHLNSRPILLMRFSLIIPLLAMLSASSLTSAPSSSSEDLGFAVFRDRCMACHLQSGMGIREMNAPAIAGIPRWYVTDQLRKFRRDQRGYHADDAARSLMQANALALDEKSIAFVGRHIESLAPNEGRKTLSNELTKKSQSLYRTQSQECHGEDGEGNRSNRVPPLTSQQDWCLFKQIENFQTGKRIHFENHSSNKLDEEQLQSIVAWICSLPARPTE